MNTSYRADYDDVPSNVGDDAIDVENKLVYNKGVRAEEDNDDDAIEVENYFASAEEDGHKVEEEGVRDRSVDEAVENYSFDTGDEETSVQNSTSGYLVKLISDLIFVIGSLLYVILAFEPIEYYQWSDSLGLPQDVVENATDDAFWWTWYDENGLIPEDVYYADNATLYAWYEDSFPSEHIVFDVGNTYVTRFMIYYFSAALCFLLTGILSFWVYRHWFGIVMVLAAAFGVASSLFVVKDEWLAIVFNSVSIHLFSFEAIYLLLCYRRQDRLVEQGVAVKSVSEDSVKALFAGDSFFVMGTLADLYLSYVSLLGSYRLPHAYSAVGAAGCWLICSIVYLFVTVVEHHRQKDMNMPDYTRKGEETDGSDQELAKP